MSTDRPWDLRVEHLDRAVGIDATQPRLSWKLPTGSSRQLAWEIDADGWGSGRVEGPEHLLVRWGGEELGSRQQVDWRVRVWSDRGRSRWSEPCHLEMGLLEPGDWSARWISPAEPDGPGPAGHRPAHLLRCDFVHSGTTDDARLYATAHGIYELFLNGERVGDRELTPGFTSYANRLQVQTHEVGDLLVPGDNQLLAVLSDGWFRGQVGYHRHDSVWGESLALLAQLEVDREAVAGTDDTWECAIGAITSADLIEGERCDLRRVSDLDWAPVVPTDHSLDRLCASPAPPVRRTQSLVPTSVTRLDSERQVVDLGQNINGWLRITDVGPAGTEVTITHGEALDDDGDVDVEHLRPFDWAAGEHRGAGQTDGFVSDGIGPFEPRHTTHGFRFARVEGHPRDLTVDDVTGVVVHTDLRRTGWFRCSDPALERLHEIARWSFLGNACDIPTDCPQREREGWAGDWQVFAPTAAFLYDVAGFSDKWLADLAADQSPEGVIANYAPEPVPRDPAMRAIDASIKGGAGWGDAIVLVPWAMWEAYGDLGLLERMWPAMAAWVEHQATAARDARHRSRVERSPTPLPHELYLWDTGWHWGEWLEPARGVDWH
ncbi:MAG: family 78 glycoside hydrolase catalytic domain, partial [Microthrixaceae bacterium]